MVSALIALLAVGGQEVAPEILLVLNKGEDSVRLVDVRDGKEIKTVKTGHGPNEVMVAPGGGRAVISNMGNQTADKTLTVLKMPSGDVERTIDLGEYSRPHGMAFLDDERVVVTTHQPDAIHIVDFVKGEVMKSMESPSKGIHMVVLSPDKKVAYTACAFGNQMVAFDLEKWSVKAVVDCGPRAEGIAISPDGKTLTVGNVGDDTVTVIDTKSMKVTRTLKGCPAPIRTMWSGDGKWVFVSAAGSREMVVFESSEWKEEKRIELGGLKGDGFGAAQGRMPMNFAWGNNGKSLWFVLVGVNAVAELDVDSMEVKRAVASGEVPDGIAVWRAKS